MNLSRILIYFNNLVFGLIELIIALRLILKLFGANPSTPFVAWVNGVSDSLIYPFQGIFPSPVLSGGFVLEVSAIIALLVYAIVGYIIGEIIAFISFHSPTYRVVTTPSGKKKVIREE